MKKFLACFFFIFLFLPTPASAWVWIENVARTVVVEDSPTVDTSAYAAGDCIVASAQELTGAGKAGVSSGRILSVELFDKAGNGKNVDVVFFSSDPGTVCSAVNAAYDLDDADLSKIVGIVKVRSHDAWTSNSLSQDSNINLPFVVDDNGTSLYYALIAQDAITYGAATDLTIQVGIDQD